MAIETKYVCDRCAHVQVHRNDPRGMKSVRVFVDDDYHGMHTSSHRWTSPEHEALWCTDCIAKVGIKFYRPSQVPDDAKPTIEDMIREIVRTEAPQQ